MGLLGKNIPDYSGYISDAQNRGTQIGSRYGSMLSDAMHQGFMQQDQESEIMRRDAARKAYGDAWASGDPKAIERVMQQFPEFAKKAQEFIGVRDEQHRKDLGSLMAQLNALAGSGDFKGAVDLVNRSGSTIDPESSTELKSILADAMSPDAKTSGAARQHFSDLTDSLSLTALTPEELDQHKRLMRQQTEVERRDREAHEDRQSRNADLRYRANHPTLGRGGADHTKGMRGKDLAQYIIQNGVMPDGSRPAAADYDWAERFTGLKKTTGGGKGSGGFGGGGTGKPTASENLLQHDIDFIDSLLNSAPDSLSPLVGVTGGIGEVATGADAASKYREANGDGDARKALAAVKRIQGAMRNKGIADAKSMGASGINTENEARMFFEGMPQLDFSSIDSLQSSLMDISDYVHNYVPEDQGDGDLSSDDQSLVDKYYQGE